MTMRQVKWAYVIAAKDKLYYEKATCKCSCGRKYLLVPLKNEVIECACGLTVDSRTYSLSPHLRSLAEHPRPPL